MKSVIILACVLAVAAAQFNNGQYVPEQNRHNNYNRYNNYNNRYNNYNNQYPYNKYQNQYRPVASSTPFPSYYVSSTAAPSTVAPSRATFAPFKFFSSTVAPSVIVPAAVKATPALSASRAPSAAPSAAPSVAPLKPVYASIAPAAPALVSKYYSEGRAADIISYESEINPDGAFRYAFQTSNGIAAQEEGAPRSYYSGKDAVAPVVAQGSFAWTSPEGQVVQISYVADENGYQPRGDTIPQAPAIPELIARSLEYITRTAPLSSQ